MTEQITADTDSRPEHYTAETTTNLDEVQIARKGGGDGVYNHDYGDESVDISKEIAEIAIDAGGRVPANYSFECVENDGASRQRIYKIYVPAAQRFHVAADIKDLLTGTDGVDSETIEIGEVAEEIGELDFLVELKRSTADNTREQIRDSIKELR